MEKIKNWFIKNRDYFYPGVITFVVMFIAFIVKGVFPFGNAYSAMVDYVAGLVPSYSYLWDFLHGKASVFFVETLGNGANIYASSILNTFLSPVSWVVGLFPRSSIHYVITYIIVIKMMLMATTSYIMFKKWFNKTNTKTLCIFSLLWAFSSWFFVHASNVGWLDVMIIFPFLLDSIKDIIEKGKLKKFVILLSLCLMFSYYMSYMILVMMVVGIATACFTIIKKEDRKRIIGQITVGTLFSLFISMFAFLPSFMQTQDSYRFTDVMTKDNNNPIFTKTAMLVFYGALIYYPLKLYIKHRNNKNVLFLMIFVILTTITVILEPINKMWHTGSYFSYPYRFSFIPIFFLIISSLYYVNDYHNEDEKEPVKLKGWETIVLNVSIILFFVGHLVSIASNLYLYAHLQNNIEFGTFILYLIPGISSLLIIHYFGKKSKVELRQKIVSLVSFVQIGLFAIGYMGYEKESINYIYEIKDGFDLSTLNQNYGIKDETCEMIANFPLVLDYKSTSNWIHINSQYENINAISLGYSNVKTMIFSYGGTVFSDILSNTRYVLSLEELDTNFYNFIEKEKVKYNDEKIEVYLYEYKYNLPLSLIMDKDVSLEELDVTKSPFYNQNYLYQTAFKKTDNIVEVILDDENVETREYTINITGDKFLYVNSESKAWNDTLVYVNGKLIDLNYQNSIVQLGTYSNESVTVKIESEESLDKVEFATVSLDDIKQFTEEMNNNTSVKVDGNKVTIKVDSTKEGKLYIPINFEDSSWTSTVNGEEKEVSRFMETYLSVDVEQGNNEIVLKFTPKMFGIGVKLTILSIVTLLILWLLDFKVKWFTRKWIIIPTGILGIVLGVVLGGYIYIGTMISWLLSLF